MRDSQSIGIDLKKKYASILSNKKSKPALRADNKHDRAKS